jgi:hypothetical protein
MNSEEEMDSVDELAITDRRNGERRRTDRRKKQIPVAVERRSGKDRRDRPERRRQVDPTTCEKDYSDEEILFMKAMDQYKRANRRPFPTWSEVLEVLHALGYRKVEATTPLPGLPVTAPQNGV